MSAKNLPRTRRGLAKPTRLAATPTLTPLQRTNMLVHYLVISAFVAFANSVTAATTTLKSPSTKTKKSQTTIKSNNSSSKCYDDQFVHSSLVTLVLLRLSYPSDRGNIIPCKMSPTTRIIVGVLVGQLYMSLGPWK